MKLTKVFKCLGNLNEKNGEILHLLCKQIPYIYYINNFGSYKSMRTF